MHKLHQIARKAGLAGKKMVRWSSGWKEK